MVTTTAKLTTLQLRILMAGVADAIVMQHWEQTGLDRKDHIPLQLKYHHEVYRTFLLDRYLVNHGLTYTEIDYFSKTIKSPNKDKKGIQQLIKDFESSMHFIKVRFAERECFTKQDVPGLTQLIFNGDGTPKSEIQSFLLNSTQQFKNHGKFYLELYKENSEPCCKVYANDGEKCDRIAKQIIHAIGKHIIPTENITEKQDLHNFIQLWRQRGKFVSSVNSKKTLVFVYCTNDLATELIQLLSEPPSEVVSVADHYVAFFKQYGQDLLDAEEKHCNVTASLNPDDRNLMIQGSQTDRETFKERLKTSIHKEFFTLTKRFTQDESTQFDNVADRLACSWSCNVLDQPEDRHIEGCEYLTTFYHPGCPGSLSCIIGDVTQLNVDGMVIMVTDKIVPLHRVKGFQEIGLDYFTGTCRYRGDVVYRKTLKIPYRCALGLVTEYSNSILNSVMPSDVMRDLMQSLEQYKCKTVCMPVTVMTGKHAIDEYVEILVDTYIKKKWEEKEIHLHLCFDRGFNDVDTIYKLVEEKFRRTTGRFLRRRIGQDNADSIVGISIKTESTVLQHLMVDAIVNPTTHNLDFSKGYVSRSLLEAAGAELQRKCSTDCPHGLDNNKVLVTPPYKLCNENLVLKVIIHGALPPFNMINYQKDIKTFMKLCMTKAEELGFKSIAFPALGTGNHGNPKRETIKVMLDAVEEFSRESLANKLQTVVFALPDNESNTRENLWRSTTVKPYLQENVGLNFLEGTFKTNNNTVAIIFGQNFEWLPSYTVDVHFDVGLQESHRFSYATEGGSYSQYDSLTVRMGVANNDTKELKYAMKSCLDYCKSQRITEIRLNRIKNLHLGTGEYYQAVVEEIKNFVKSCRTGGIVASPYGCCYVSKIYVTATDIEMSILHSQFIETPGSTFGGLTSMWGGRILNWQTYKSGPTQKPVQIQVLGKSKEAVCQVKRDMMDILDRGTPNVLEDGQFKRIPEKESYNGARPKLKQQSTSKHNTNNDNTITETTTTVNNNSKNTRTANHEPDHKRLKNDDTNSRQKGEKACVGVISEKNTAEVPESHKDIGGTREKEYSQISKASISDASPKRINENADAVDGQLNRNSYVGNDFFESLKDNYDGMEDEKTQEGEPLVGVSAQINPKVIQNKREQNTLERWIHTLSTEFDLEIMKRGFRYFVHGSLTELVNFTEYLKNHSHQEPSKLLWRAIADPERFGVDEIEDDRLKSENSIVSFTIEENEGRVLVHLYSVQDFDGLSEWDINGDLLRATCKLQDKDKTKDAIREKLLSMIRKECNFEEDIDAFMAAKREVNDLNEHNKLQAYLEVIEEHYKIIIYGKNEQAVTNAEKMLYSKLGERHSDFLMSLTSIGSSTVYSEQKKKVFRELSKTGMDNKIKLYIGNESLTTLAVDSIVCHQNRLFSLKHGLTQQVYELLGTDGQKLIDSEVGKLHTENLVYEVPVNGGNLSCRYLQFVVLPDRRINRLNFEDAIINSVIVALEYADVKGYKTVAFPLLGREGFHCSSVEACTSALVRGIFKYVNEGTWFNIRGIHLIDDRADVIDLLKHKVREMTN